MVKVVIQGFMVSDLTQPPGAKQENKSPILGKRAQRSHIHFPKMEFLLSWNTLSTATRLSNLADQ